MPASPICSDFQSANRFDFLEKSMKKIIIITFLLSSTAHASMQLFCKKGSAPASCALAAEAALEKIGCNLDKERTTCTYSRIEDPKNPDSTIRGTTPYCEITSDNCSQPLLGNFGGETCFEGSKTQISKADGVNNGYWFGLFGSYSRTICRIE